MFTKHIPNTITSLNLLCGLAGVVFAFKGRIDIAFPFMLAASLCDFCDGLSARLLNAYSDMGKELDSLSDLVSFGVLPSVMLMNTCKACSFCENWFCFVPLLIALFSALRLAKFNVDSRQHSSFLGLPSPASALLCGSMCCFVAYNPASFLSEWFSSPVFIVVFTALMCSLLVCELPMFSMKFSKDDDKTLKLKRILFFSLVVIGAVVTILLKQTYSLVVLFAFIVYILKNIVYYIFKV